MNPYQQFRRNSNCFIYAWRRWRTEGGYFVIRRSHYGWWWHFEFSPNRVDYWQYGPKDPIEGMLSPPLIFDGKVTHGTGDEHKGT